MPRGRGNNRGFRPGPPRGGGRGRGGGFRGPFHGGGGGLLDGNDQGTLVFEGNFEDFNLDHVMPPNYRRGASPARGRRGYQTPPRGFQGRGGRGNRGGKTMRGIGFPANSMSASGGSRGRRISLSTLERDRPLLRPVLFIRGEHQKTLFQEVEEILHVPGEEGGEIEDHAPSADIVERLFQRGNPAEEISTDMGKDGASTSESEEQVETEIVVEATVAIQEALPTFIIDTSPSPIVLDSHPQESNVDLSVVGAAPLGETIEEEVIVYVAPHPRTGRSTPAVPSPSLATFKPLPDLSDLSSTHKSPGPSRHSGSTALDSISITLTPSSESHPNRAAQAQARTRAGLKSTPRSRKIAKKERAAARRREERQAMFSSTVTVEERRILEDGSATKNDPRHAERRRGDSDVDWGTDDDEEDGIEEVRNGLGDMDLDAELGDLAAFAQFARGVPGLGAEEVVTIADLDDAAKMEEEDEEEATNGDESSQDDVFDAEERREIGEDTGSDSSSDESSGRGFQARLRRLREKAKGRAVVDADPSSDEQDTDGEGVFGPGFSWADRDESFLEGIQDLLDENAEVLRGGDRKTRNKLFKAIQNGDFEDDYDSFDSLNMRKKDRTIPPDLRDQWDRDRAKKAERKRSRALARLQAVSEASTRKSPGKKKQKIFGAARLDGDTLFTGHVNDMALLEQQIRNFLGDVELKSMVLPPKGKEWRRRAHLLAEAFNLKSKSKGKGDGRFTTLIKTTRSGVGVNERKIGRLVYGNKGEGFGPASRPGKTVRHREGDAVGKAAPKLSETNIGFKLLQQMGWEEGDRIGVTGGLVNPLTAIIKTTKLGLGATR